ncbi:MAG TPA: anhydro-N-acetylmuramic acid kinase, partial [Gemmatimonadota bacterium]|nr:anhydro-N-acetylmuramic acid kinase [Gemmatimonadota bacterium]
MTPPARTAVTPLERLAAALRAPDGALVVGLISGTSADGVDAACCRLAGRGGSLKCEVLSTAATPYPRSVGPELRSPADLDAPAVARLSVAVGAAFAEAALAAIAAAGKEREEIALVGSHGQTIWHDPRGTRGGVGCTLQIGEAAEIAERTGLPVWHDFRPADVAAGGEGAPLVPYADWVLFTLVDSWTVCLNVGGIANLTLLPPAAGIQDVVAFDTGPGNMALDHLAATLLGRPHDEEG